MLTRFKVTGFKNLVDVDLRFGPFTCIAGSNGVGKSNLFDALRFLNALSRVPLLEAAKEVRGGKTADVRGLFHRVGDTYDNMMSFEAEMIVPRSGKDDLGQEAEASMTFLRYKLTLGYRPGDGGLEIQHEELVHINKGDANRNILFPYTYEWLESAVVGRRTSPFISTIEEEPGNKIIYLHQDRGEKGSGKPAPRRANSLPRTVLQGANAAENRTAVIARREMQSWRLIQLEPSALREPDEFNAPSRLSEHGSHLPAMLFRLAQSDEARTYAAVANRLSELIADIRAVGVDRDEKLERLTLWAQADDGTPHAARSLSEGTLRFLALTVLEQDPDAQGVLCLEEPENGIHPARIPAMIRLLTDIAVDTDHAVGRDNPLRQVIINTHSPAVVGEVNSADLVGAELLEQVKAGQRFKSVVFQPLPGTWRASGIAERDLMPKNRLLEYLSLFEKEPQTGGANEPSGDEATNSTSAANEHSRANGHSKQPRIARQNTRIKGSQRVVDRSDIQLLLFGGSQIEGDQ